MAPARAAEPATDAPPAEALPLRHAVALGVLHGPAELLPISSSAHITLVPWLLGWPYAELDPELRKAFEVALHAGTAAALLIALRHEIPGVSLRRLELMALSFAPPAFVGKRFERPIEEHLGTPPTIAAGLAVGSLAMSWPTVPPSAAAATTPARSTRCCSGWPRPAR